MTRIFFLKILCLLYMGTQKIKDTKKHIGVRIARNKFLKTVVTSILVFLGL